MRCYANSQYTQHCAHDSFTLEKQSLAFLPKLRGAEIYDQEVTF